MEDLVGVAELSSAFIAKPKVFLKRKLLPLVCVREREREKEREKERKKGSSKSIWPKYSIRYVYAHIRTSLVLLLLFFYSPSPLCLSLSLSLSIPPCFLAGGGTFPPKEVHGGRIHFSLSRFFIFSLRDIHNASGLISRSLSIARRIYRSPANIEAEDTHEWERVTIDDNISLLNRMTDSPRED